MNTEESKSFISNIDVQTAPVNVGNSTYEEAIPDGYLNITIGVFIDGTLNNAENTKARQAYEKEGSKSNYEKKQSEIYKNLKRNNSKDDLVSYSNDLSNVAIMETAYKEIISGNELQSKIYTQGMGSTKHTLDDSDGTGLAEGPSGIKARVEEACEQIVVEIRRLLKNNDIKKISVLRIDVFGFSRGAAAARHFMYEATRPIRESNKGRAIKTYYGKLGEFFIKYEIDQPILLQFRFAGLFDTVASYGKEHNLDTFQLDLDAVKKAKHTFHLVAQDEHRENFVITNIKSTGASGVEKYIPGVHSDIGGGYTDNYKEDYLVIREGYSSEAKENGSNAVTSNRLRDFLIRDSWYRPSEIYVNEYSLKKDTNQHIDPYYAVIINRTIKSKRYSYISLHLMVQYGVKKSIPLDYTFIKDKYTLDEEISVVLPNKTVYTTNLKDIKKRLYKYVFYGAAPMKFDNPDDENMIRAIRANCMHTSAHYSGKIDLVDKWGIHYWYAPHNPRESYFTRKREENNG
ncbi:Protein of unknown function DUF2235 [Cellulophaga algicola DSM 14237]|uniref:T6SS Phospholipase effector Tle1-like catalytic domain-containing protein n=1 Tax=Cellulophaga algicola (strain DSM 14237 / IC166 / ACAM 630) TaxID=688270 RepID=E6XD46_CELAD|nr:DUF2235 domain-containing protein [Cellulophaga algicola]ADV51233.1 Protein of unknown function DUF2235 [Cellulophaga algicola DSM 14237]